MESQQNTQKAAALKELHDSGVLTDQEYQQKLAQLKAGGSTAAPAGAKVRTASAGAGAGHVWKMKKVEVRESVVDLQTMAPTAPMDAMTMLVPTDWTFDGHASTSEKMDCNYTLGRFNVLAASPDKGSGVQILAQGTSVWSQNQGLLRQVDEQNRQPYAATLCPIHPTKTLLAVLTEAGSALFQGKPMGGLEPLPGFSDQLPAMLDQANQGLSQQAAQQRMQAPHLAAQAGRLRVSGTKDGHAVEAWIIALQTVRSDPAPGGGTLDMADLPLLAVMYAPVGQLDANEKMFSAMLDSVQVNPKWTAFCSEFVQSLLQKNQQTANNISRIYANMAQDNAKAASDQAAIRRGAQQYANQSRANVAANQSAAFEHSAQQFALHMGDQAIYTDPSTGHSVQMSNQYDHAWASTTGNTNEYILTDSASFDPNGHVGSGQWTQMQQQR